MKKILVILFLFLLFPAISLAADFKSDYKVEYTIEQTDNTIKTKVAFKVAITNLKSDVYVKKFALIFPKPFLISNLKANDDKTEVAPIVTETDDKINLELEFSDPKTGRDTTNNFYLNFYQVGLFQQSGNIWEVILPTMQDKEQSTYQAIVNLPAGTDKKISIAKPKPDLNNGSQMVWNNPSTRTIYAVFGDRQYYQTDLIYHLRNPRLTPVYTDVAFPPDTLYQKIYVNSIDPQPASVFIDEDGNYLGRYYLNPKETKAINFSGVIELFSQPREEMKPILRSTIIQQKKYLLNESKYWKLDNPEDFPKIKTPEEVYSYVTSNLTYDFSKLKTDNERLGAAKALLFPDRAVCIEFSDLFVALAREKGILAREVQGYGFSQDSRLRPLSLTSDILHSWPEYYDQKNELWMAVDPTWENTSGIDYYSSLDLNHVAFAIHGKRPDYPAAAGMYKLEDTQDILIKPIKTKPDDRIAIVLDSIALAEKINDSNNYTLKFKLRNNSNIFVNNIEYRIEADGLTLNPSTAKFLTMPPFETKDIEIKYQARNKNIQSVSSLKIFLNDKEMYTASVKITPYYYEIALVGALVLLGVLVLILLLRILKRN